VVKKRKDVKSLGFGAPIAPEKSGGQSVEPTDLAGMMDDKTSASEEHAERDMLVQKVEANDLIQYGLIPEFVGRMPIVVPLHSLTEDMLVQILTQPQNALVKQYEHSFSLDDCRLEITEEALRAIAQVTLEKQTGARGLRSEVEKTLLMPMYEQPGSDIKTVIINEDVIRNDAAPIYIHEQDEDKLRQTV